MWPAGASGFQNAPVTKGVVFSVGSCTIGATLLELNSSLHLHLIPNLTTQHEFWRLLTHHCAFSSTREAFIGGLVLYHLRIIERQFGSAKYAAFLFVSSALSTLLEVGVLAAGRTYGLTYLPAGPYSLIFANLYQYHRIIPTTTVFSILGLPINDKLIMYTLGLYLLIFEYPASVITAICGILASALYQNGIVGLKRWRFPSIINRLASRILLPLLSSSASHRHTPSDGVTLDQRIQGQTTAAQASSSSDLQNNYNYLTTPSPAATEEQLETLRAMFPDSPRETIIQAIEAADNDINRAVQFLLDRS